MTDRLALVRRPGPLLADGLVTHIARSPVDLALAQEQWDGYVRALVDHGWPVLEVPGADDCADAVFVEDAVVVFGNVAVITRPGAESRRPETVDVEKTIESLHLSINRIVAPERSTAVTC